MPRWISLCGLGCKVNQFEIASLEEAFLQRGYKVVSAGEEAELCIVNTCTVTAKSDRQSRQLIRKLRRRHPKALLVATGCYAQVSPEDLLGMEEVDLVIGNDQKYRIPAIVEQQNRSSSAQKVKRFGEEAPYPKEQPIRSFPNHTRAFVKVQDGCRWRCTYCIIPTARGPSRSKPLKEVMDQVKLLEKEGFKEVVLTGVNLGCYGLDLSPSMDLLELLKGLLSETTIPRIRLSSIEPQELTEELIALIGSSERICNHLHIPLQSGDKRILESMGRPYSPERFRQRVETAFGLIKDLTLGMDMIVGFPGEDKGSFEKTTRFLESLPFAYLHVFPYSSRPGTPASTFRLQVDPSTKKNRGSLLRRLAFQRRRETYLRQVGRTLSILVEGCRSGERDLLQGLSSNYLRVIFRGPHRLINSIVHVKITTVKADWAYGILSS